MGAELGKELEREPLGEEKEEQVEVETGVEESEGEMLSPEETQQSDEPEEIKRKLEEQREKADDYFARLARLQADFENFRRRTRQEKEDLAKYATEHLMIDLLQVLDNFERALNLQAKENKESFMEGMEMIYRQLKDVLTKEGLTVIPSVGELFDPNKHDAVLQEESDEHPDNTVTEELRRGYILKDRVIRPAMVKVAKSV